MPAVLAGHVALFLANLVILMATGISGCCDKQRTASTCDDGDYGELIIGRSGFES
jgi:hypothetical protein